MNVRSFLPPIVLARFVGSGNPQEVDVSGVLSVPSAKLLLVAYLCTVRRGGLVTTQGATSARIQCTPLAPAGAMGSSRFMDMKPMFVDSAGVSDPQSHPLAIELEGPAAAYRIDVTDISFVDSSAGNVNEFVLGISVEPRPDACFEPNEYSELLNRVKWSGNSEPVRGSNTLP